MRSRSRSGGQYAPASSTRAPAVEVRRSDPISDPVAPAPFETKSALSLYMRDAIEVPLLTIDEENALAARIKRGDTAAREHMIRANLRLVVKIARDYDGFGLPLLDLINEGNIGLMKGVERFDPAKGGKLSTYASWWIKQSIKRALANQSKTIRLPVHLVDKVTKLKRVAHQLQELLGREATDEELAEEMEVPVKKIRFWQRASQKTASLDAPLGDDDSSRLSDLVPDSGSNDPYGQLEEKTTHRMVGQFLGILDSRELSILRQRFGLDGQKEKTLDEIGRTFGVTRERIRQLQNIALAKLRERIEKHEAVREPAGDSPAWTPLAAATL
ncbi:MAG: RNA polymerase sigma factor RpoD/SigA [Verrucomicrobiae bacterium]|nr:RNA polymerase sigma factor RpoD/SigA [Verrucomicrobiae bacterium]